MTKDFQLIGPAPVQRFSVLIPTGHGVHGTGGLVEFRFKNPVTLGGRPSVTVWNETTATVITAQRVSMDGDDIVISVDADVAAATTALSVTVIG